MGVLILIVYLFVFYLIFYVYYYKKKAVLKRNMRKVPACNIADVKDGKIAKIVGNAKLSEGLIVAPISGRPCIAFELIIEREKRSSKGRVKKETMLEDENIVDFIIEQGDDKIMVISRYNELILRTDRKFYGGFLNNPDQRLLNYLKLHNIPYSGRIGSSVLSFKEGILAPDEKLAVVGTIQLNSYEHKDVNNKNIPIIYGVKKNPLLISDITTTMRGSYEVDIMIEKIEIWFNKFIKRMKKKMKERKKRRKAERMKQSQTTKIK